MRLVQHRVTGDLIGDLFLAVAAFLAQRRARPAGRRLNASRSAP